MSTIVPSTFPLRFFGAVSAGFPSPAQGYEDEPLDLNELLIRHPAATFFFRVQGDSLRAEGIGHGSLLVVDRSLKPKTGSIVVADLNGEREVCHMPSNVGADEGFTVWGVVTAVVIRLRP